MQALIVTVPLVDDLDDDISPPKPTDGGASRKRKRNVKRRWRQSQLNKVRSGELQLRGKAVGSRFAKELRLQPQNIPDANNDVEMIQDEAPQQAEVQQQGQFNHVIIHLQPADKEAQTEPTPTATSGAQTEPKFTLPSPISTHEFMELVRINIPSPRYMPLQAFISDINHEPSFSLYTKTFFAGMDDPLSNFYPCPLVIDNTSFPSLEHAYQYRKAVYCQDDAIAAQIYRAVTPNDTKRIAKALPKASLDSFAKIKFQEMAWLLEHKFTQSAKFRSKLKPGVYYCEATLDVYWACGRRKRETVHNPRLELQGLNKLGLMLTRLAHRGTLLRDDWRKYV